MKIALPSHQNQVDEHFGHCDSFTIFTVDEQNKILEKEILTPPPGCGCKSNIAQTLAHMGVKVLLAGNMGQGAVNILGQNGIQVMRGCTGDVLTVAENWLSGHLKDSGLACTQHDHDCHNH